MTIMRGLPASGKSTKAQELLKVGNTVRINKDLLRTMLHFDKFTGHNESHTRDAARKLTDWFLANDVNVIIDDTNLNEGTVQGWKDLARIHNAKIEYVDCLDVSVEECIKRDSAREKRVGTSVIQKMALQHLGYMKGEKVIICDLDGTLCNIDHRLHFVQKEPKDWKGFFEHMLSDTPRPEIKHEIINAHINGIKIVFVSARPENYRAFTMDWLRDHVGIQEYILIMREVHDKREDTEVKSDIYDKYLKNMDILKIYDDRPSVIRMWKEKGLNVIDVGKGVEF